MLSQVVPRNIAFEFLFTGDFVDAQKALQLMLVNYVVEPDQVMARAEELARMITANAPLSLAAIKEASIKGSTDGLRGCKENVIMGRLIPAGTLKQGFRIRKCCRVASSILKPDTNFSSHSFKKLAQPEAPLVSEYNSVTCENSGPEPRQTKTAAEAALESVLFNLRSSPWAGGRG